MSSNTTFASGGLTLVVNTGLPGPRGVQGPGISGPDGLVITKVSDGQLRFTLPGADGISRSTLLTLLPDEPVIEAPNLASIALYRDPVNTRAYFNIPYAAPGEPQRSWVEAADNGRTHRQEFDIEVPVGTPPQGGWPSLGHFHPAGSDKTVTAGSGSIGQLKAWCLERGVAFWSASFRNPKTNYNWDGQGGISTNDPGLVIQKVRSLAPALGLSTVDIAIICRSKGNSAILRTLMGNMANPSGITHASRQSSLPSFIWGIGGQWVYSSARWAAAFVPEANRAAFLAAEPDIAGMPNTVDYVATAGTLPPMVLCYEGAFVGAPSIGATTDIHWADNGLLADDAFTAAGQPHKLARFAGEASGAEQSADLLDTWERVRAGVPVREALFISRTRRRGAAAWYARSDGSGIYATDTGTGSVAIGGTIGAIADGSYGIANRSVGAGALGFACAQSSVASRPTLQQSSGAPGQLVIRFDSTNDKLASAYANDGTPNFRAYTQNGVVTTYVSASSAVFQWGLGPSETALAGKDVSLAVVQDAAISPADETIYALWAHQLSGYAYPALRPTP